MPRKERAEREARQRAARITGTVVHRRAQVIIIYPGCAVPDPVSMEYYQQYYRELNEMDAKIWIDGVQIA